MNTRQRKPGGGRKRKADAIRRNSHTSIRMPEPLQHAVNVHLSECGESLNAYVLRLVREDLERQGRMVHDVPAP